MVANNYGAMGGFIPPGLGGGCVKTGPFKNKTANLGPIGINLQAPLMASDITPGAQREMLGLLLRRRKRIILPSWVSWIGM